MNSGMFAAGSGPEHVISAYSDDIFEIYSDHDVCRYLQMKPLECPRDAVALMESWFEDFKKGRGVRWLVYSGPGSDVCIGVMGLAHIDAPNRCCELTMALKNSSRYAGKGGESIPVLLDIAFGDMHMERAELRCHPQHRVSRRLAEKYGFVFEGVLRDYIRMNCYEDEAVYSILKGEYLRFFKING